jgi:predicted Rossmann-fold nucleotide-binding protein
MKLIIAGSRSRQLTMTQILKLNALYADFNVTEVISGGAKGVDECGEKWARAHRIPVTQFKPDCEAFGKRAGPLRNEVMARYADAVVLFPGGLGTESMFVEATKAGIQIFDWRDE